VYNYYNGRIPLERIKFLLSGKESYTLHREFHKNVRNISFSHFKRYQFQMDLVDIQSHAKANDGVRYLFTVIDTFTRYAFVRPLKDKYGKTVVNAFKSILDEAQTKPYQIVMDKGTEFNNQDFKKLCEDLKIKLTNPSASTHAAYIERFNRTLQLIIYKYMTENETNRFIDVLQDLVKTYNNRVHRIIQMPPLEAETNPDAALKINLQVARQYEKLPRKKVNFKIGDFVRIAKQKGKFSRGYNEQTTHEIFRIYQIDNRKKIPLYHLEEYDGEEKIKGGFYDFELTLVSTEIFRVEKVIKRRRYRGKNQLFVKWKGFSDKYNEWINEDQVERNFKKKFY
jgi:Integrase core domain/Chromo (CHRromatin Organisation MOdifier) domain